MRIPFNEFVEDYVVTRVRELQGKQGRTLSLLSLTPLAACGGGGGGGDAIVVPLGPDYLEDPAGTFTGRDNANLTLSQGSAATDLIVLSKGGNDTIITGSGNDTITGQSGNDLIRSGLGADSVDAGSGNDVVLVVGTTTANQYVNSDITNPGGSGLDLSSLLTLANLNGQGTSEGAAGETIDGGPGADTLVIYGTVDLTGLTIQNVTTLQVNSDVKLSPKQLEQFRTINGDGESTIQIVERGGIHPVYGSPLNPIHEIDLTTLEVTNVANISVSGHVHIRISSMDDLAGIGHISGGSGFIVKIVDDGTGAISATLSALSTVISGIERIDIVNGEESPTAVPGLTGHHELSELNGHTGFVLNGVDAGDHSGHAVSSVGDLNGDGYDDLIIGAFDAEPGGTPHTGETYVVYGGNGVDGGDGRFDLSTLNGSNGFAMFGLEAGEHNGSSVSNAGDLNGDGYDDLIIGASVVDTDGVNVGGKRYVVFGGPNVDGSDGVLDLSALNGTTGFVFSGSSSGGPYSAPTSSAGDLNGDGFDDLIIGGQYGDPNGMYSGESYLIYGGTSISGGAGLIDSSELDGTTGFVLNGINAFDNSGFSVSSVGDLNGDGYDDLIIGAPNAERNGTGGAGQGYVVYGGVAIDGGDGILDLSSLDGVSGFVLNGVGDGDETGFSVAGAGDLNGDGFDDLIIGARLANPSGVHIAGKSYVVYGGTAVDGGNGVLDLWTLDGTTGFVLNGYEVGGASGASVSGAGDLNGDGYDDLIIGAFGTEAESGGYFHGESYVVYGGPNIDGGDGSMELSDLNGHNGFKLDGIAGHSTSGRSVSGAGDVNGDGFDDLIIGAASAHPNGNIDAGESYVIYGFATSTDVHMGTTDNDTLVGNDNDERIIGREGDDAITSGSGDDVLVFDGDFGNDVVTDYTQGLDLFDFSDSEFIDDVTDLTISLVGGDTVLDDGLGNTVTLTGFTGTLTNADFDFA